MKSVDWIHFLDVFVHWIYVSFRELLFFFFKKNENHFISHTCRRVPLSSNQFSIFELRTEFGILISFFSIHFPFLVILFTGFGIWMQLNDSRLECWHIRSTCQTTEKKWKEKNEILILFFHFYHFAFDAQIRQALARLHTNNIQTDSIEIIFRKIFYNSKQKCWLKALLNQCQSFIACIKPTN